MTITIRRGSVDDVPVICALGRRMRAEAAVPFPEVDEDWMRRMLGQLGDAYFVAFAERDGEPVGMMTAQKAFYIFNPVFFVQHDILYVAPEARGSMAFFRLVKAFEAWAREIGAKRRQLAVTSGLQPEVTGRAYEKLGYRYMGKYYMSEA